MNVLLSDDMEVRKTQKMRVIALRCHVVSEVCERHKEEATVEIS